MVAHDVQVLSKGAILLLMIMQDFMKWWGCLVSCNNMTARRNTTNIFHIVQAI